jgi:hypothetical protein|tara:strand:- start:605 stop:955 length:351 start_codon:yes stop_codon:yes gene_type:complete
MNLKQSLFDILMETVDDKSFLSFCFKTREHILINLFFIKHNNQVTFELICSAITPKITSRSTIQTIINSGIESGYYLKSSNPEDKRQKIISLSKEAMITFNNWQDRYKRIWMKNTI